MTQRYITMESGCTFFLYRFIYILVYRRIGGLQITLFFFFFFVNVYHRGGQLYILFCTSLRIFWFTIGLMDKDFLQMLFFIIIIC